MLRSAKTGHAAQLQVRGRKVRAGERPQEARAPQRSGPDIETRVYMRKTFITRVYFTLLIILLLLIPPSKTASKSHLHRGNRPFSKQQNAKLYSDHHVKSAFSHLKRDFPRTPFPMLERTKPPAATCCLQGHIARAPTLDRGCGGVVRSARVSRRSLRSRRDPRRSPGTTAKGFVSEVPWPFQVLFSTFSPLQVLFWRSGGSVAVSSVVLDVFAASGVVLAIWATSFAPPGPQETRPGERFLRPRRKRRKRSKNEKKYILDSFLLIFGAFPAFPAGAQETLPRPRFLRPGGSDRGRPDRQNST